MRKELHMKKKLIAMILMTSLAAASFAGCGSTGKEEASSTPAGQTTSSSAAESGDTDSAAAEVSGDITDPAGIPKGDWVIGFSNYTVNNSWKQQMEAEFRQAADQMKENGQISDYVMLNADGDQTKQIADINDLITMGVDAICVTAITADALNDILAEAVEEGIVVIAFDNLASTDEVTSKITQSDYDYGYTCGTFIGEQLPDGGNVIVLDGAAGTDTSENRHNGMVDGLKEKSPKAEVVAAVNADWDYATAKSAIEDLLSSYPQIDAVLSQGGAMSQAAIDAFSGAGRDLVPMTGEAVNGYLRAWKESGIDSVAFTSPTYMSADALTLAVRALNGESIPEEMPLSTPTVTNGNLDEYYRPDLSDNFWTVTKLTDENAKALFAE